MYKLVILIEAPGDPSFDRHWPTFLHLVEQVPGLLRESTSRVDRVVFGKGEYSLIHELYFESAEALQRGMSSPVGQEAGRVLQAMTGGQVTLLFADHKQDDLENIRKFRSIPGEADAQADAD